MLTVNATATVQAAVRLHEAAARDIRLCDDHDPQLAHLAATAAQCWHSVLIADLVGNDVPAWIRRQHRAWFGRAMSSTTTEQSLYCLVVSDGFRHLHKIIAGDIGEDQEEYEVVPLTEPVEVPVGVPA